MSTPQKAELLITRSHLLWALRSFFHREGYLELETPSIVCSPGLEPQLDALEVTATYAYHGVEQDALERRRLQTSPEYAIKRFLGGEGRSLKRVYSLGSSFRDEPPSRTHSPEFTMLEWYARDLSLESLMDQCESLILTLAREALQHQRLDDWWRSIERDHRDPQSGERCFERLSVRDAFQRYAKIDLERCQTRDSLRAAAKSAGIRDNALHGDWDELYFQIFMDLIEPHLGQQRPTLLYDFPASQAALAKIDPQRPMWARRFELFARGIELANAFDELSDPEEQRARFVSDLDIRAARGAQLHPIDEVLLSRLPELGNCVGIALGFDRLIMSLCGVDEIDLVRLQSWSEA